MAVVSRRSRGVRRSEVAGLGRSGGGAGRRSARAGALGRSSWAAAAGWGTRGRDGRDGRDGRLHRDRAGGGVGGPGPRPLHRGGRLVWLGRMGLLRALAGRQGRVAIVRGVVCSTAFDVLRAVGILILPMP